ncbi:MAG: putative ABC transporter ATP-binding protein [candidate division BRC1 bacterium ADurb.BinA364]|nr:MAG: putative ABC transporter ATP-binding protein [candidate division BRC1 bacterium ADurb.BinA364]
MLTAAPIGQATTAREILGAFLFQGDDVDKQVRVLSGGEKTRLRLAKMLFSQANCLLLDEPTNHLDLASRETLESALRRFEGAVAIVSHDRVFLDRVATRVVEIRDGVLRSYPGNYTDYLNATDGHGFLPEGLAAGNGARPASSRPSENSARRDDSIERIMEGAVSASGDQTLSKAERIAKREKDKAAGRQRKKLERDAKALEDQAHRLERKIEEIHRRMADPKNAVDPEAMMNLLQERDAVQGELDQALRAWESACGELEALPKI